MEAWQRRELVKEWNSRKLAHVAAMHANTNYDNPDNQKSDRIRDIEQSYERIKAEIWDPSLREAEAKELDTAFMRSSRRNVARVVAGFDDPVMPGEERIRTLPE